MRKLTDRQMEDACHAYIAGRSLSEIGAAYEVSLQAVQGVLKRRGIPIRAAGQQARGGDYVFRYREDTAARIPKLPGSPMTCRACGQSPPQDVFVDTSKRYKSGRVWRGKNGICRPCAHRISALRKQVAKRWAVEYLGGRCVDCGLVDEIVDVYDFHHRDRSAKEVQVARLFGCSRDRIRVELDKCELLCATCHRRRHAIQHS